MLAVAPKDYFATTISVSQLLAETIYWMNSKYFIYIAKYMVQVS